MLFGNPLLVSTRHKTNASLEPLTDLSAYQSVSIYDHDYFVSKSFFAKNETPCSLRGSKYMRKNVSVIMQCILVLENSFDTTPLSLSL